MKNYLLLRIHRWIWNNGYLFVKFEQEVLIKYNTEEVVQRNLIYNVVIWFPNSWVRKLIVVKGNRLIIIFV